MMLGESFQGGGDIARYAAIDLGLIEVPGLALNRHCASGMACGAERGRQHHRRHGHGRDRGRFGEHVEHADGRRSARRAPTTGRSGCRRRTPSSPTRPRSTCRSRSAGTPRRRPASPAPTATSGPCVRTSARSQAIDEGRFDEEIFPIEVKMRDGTTKIFDIDEHPRRDSTMEKMASLKPLHPEIEDFPITAGNASGLNDGAAAMMIVSSDYAAAHGLTPLAKIVSWASTGVPTRATPASARSSSIPKALERAGLTIADVEPRRDQRGVRVGAGRRVPQARPLGGHHQRRAAPAARSATRSRPPAPA